MPRFNKLGSFKLEILLADLQAAFGTTDVGCIVRGDNADIDVPDGTSEAAVDAVIAAYVDAPTQEELIIAVESGAKTQVSNIPGWATWDEATALTWFDTNIGSNLPVANLTAANAVLADMATVQRNLVRLVIALRNKQFPDLQG